MSTNQQRVHTCRGWVGAIRAPGSENACPICQLHPIKYPGIFLPGSAARKFVEKDSGGRSSDRVQVLTALLRQAQLDGARQMLLQLVADGDLQRTAKRSAWTRFVDYSAAKLWKR